MEQGRQVAGTVIQLSLSMSVSVLEDFRITVQGMGPES